MSWTTRRRRTVGGPRSGAPFSLNWTLALVLVLSAPGGMLRAQQFDFFHGGDYESARRIFESRLTPWTVHGLAGGEGGEAPWTRYTDFGMGFYTHVPGQFELAREWARRKAKAMCAPGQREARWGVVVFRVDPLLLQPIDSGAPARALYFGGKADRPWNAPWSRRYPGYRQSWLEFVEANRHSEEWSRIQRPDDYDWSEVYAWIQGPIWVPRDSGVDAGGDPIPESILQRNWLREGLDRVLNDPRTQRQLVDGIVPCADSSAGGYGVFLARNDVLVGIREELEAKPACRLGGWGIDCGKTVGDMASLRAVAGPFATEDEAVSWFCANIEPGSYYRPPLARFLQGARLRFDGEQHIISNAPGCG